MSVPKAHTQPRRMIRESDPSGNSPDGSRQRTYKELLLTSPPAKAGGSTLAG